MALFKKAKNTQPEAPPEEKTRDIEADLAAMDELAAENQTKKGLFKRQKKNKNSKGRRLDQYPLLCEIKPREVYIFHSDYYRVDGRWVSILSFFHKGNNSQGWPAFWGVNRIPTGLANDVQIILFDQVRRMTDNWVEDHMSVTENVTNVNRREQSANGTNSNRFAANQKDRELQELTQELDGGAAYLHLHFRLMVSASSLDGLDKAIGHISRQYTDRFSTLSVAPYHGEQRPELSSLFLKVEKKIGHGFYMTSTEFAGAYSLVTHGVEDPGGEYVGKMYGDVNNAAVLFDVDNYRRSVVVADEGYEKDIVRSHTSALWGSKLSQACMLNGRHVVHLILDGTDLDMLGPKFENLTYRIDMNSGDVNMFEMFGKRKDQLSIFASQMQKLVLMAEQAYECTDSDRAIIRGSLEELATQFYIDSRMWYDNAKQNQDKLRVVAIPHEQVPTLAKFCAYADSAYANICKQTARDDERVHALSVLATTFKNLLKNNGDLFDTITTPVIDGAETGQRVIYDFSRLLRRGTGIAMAQLVNVLGFAVGNVREGDVFIIHGAEKVADTVKPYFNVQLNRLYDAGGRTVFLYNSIDTMLDDDKFCNYVKADYKIFGAMTAAHMEQYQEAVGQDVPADLKKLIVNAQPMCSYIQRGFDNIIFERQLMLCRPGEEGVDSL